MVGRRGRRGGGHVVAVLLHLEAEGGVGLLEAGQRGRVRGVAAVCGVAGVARARLRREVLGEDGLREGV